jgi:hypothetical protein
MTLQTEALTTSAPTAKVPFAMAALVDAGPAPFRIARRISAEVML